ncbi:MAG: hypothetical protein WD424_09450, partial [Paenibacillaceae bacterium]
VNGISLNLTRQTSILFNIGLLGRRIVLRYCSKPSGRMASAVPVVITTLHAIRQAISKVDSEQQLLTDNIKGGIGFCGQL